MQVCGAVDGNVVRVFSRLRAIGAHSDAKAASDHFWLGSLISYLTNDLNQYIVFLKAACRAVGGQRESWGLQSGLDGARGHPVCTKESRMLSLSNQ